MNSNNRTFIVGILIFVTIIIFVGILFFNYQDFFVNQTNNDETQEAVSLITPATPASDSKMALFQDKVFNKLGDATEKVMESKQVNKFLDNLPNKLTSLVFKGKKTKNSIHETNFL